jgi:hypothetical protein
LQLLGIVLIDHGFEATQSGVNILSIIVTHF